MNNPDKMNKEEVLIVAGVAMRPFSQAEQAEHEKNFNSGWAKVKGAKDQLEEHLGTTIGDKDATTLLESFLDVQASIDPQTPTLPELTEEERAAFKREILRQKGRHINLPAVFGSQDHQTSPKLLERANKLDSLIKRL